MEDNEEDGVAEGIKEIDTVKREADGVVPGEGEAKEPLVGKPSGIRDPGGGINGVG